MYLHLAGWKRRKEPAFSVKKGKTPPRFSHTSRESTKTLRTAVDFVRREEEDICE
jgi:hypothetical protein